MNNLIRLHNGTQADSKLYELYVLKHPESTFFHSFAYIHFLQETLNVQASHLLSFDGETLNGVLPILQKNGPLGIVYNSLPYYGSNGGVLANDHSIAKDLILHYNELITKQDVLAAVWVENTQSLENYSELVKHSLTDYRIGQLTPIAYDVNHEENLMESFHYKTRNMVRKGMKSGFSIKIDNTAIEFLSETHNENMMAIGGKAKSAAFFTFPQYFIPDKDFKIWVAYENEKPIAAVLLFYYNNIVEYFTPVIKEAYRDRQPLSYLILESMVEASKNGFRLWNWGGTWASQSGVYTFKKRWGTIDKNYEYYIQVNNELVYNQTPAYFIEHYPDFFVVPFNNLKI